MLDVLLNGHFCRSVRSMHIAQPSVAMMNGWKVRLNNRNQITAGTSFSIAIGLLAHITFSIRWKRVSRLYIIGTHIWAHDCCINLQRLALNQSNARFFYESDRKVFGVSCQLPTLVEPLLAAIQSSPNFKRHCSSDEPRLNSKQNCQLNTQLPTMMFSFG